MRHDKSQDAEKAPGTPISRPPDDHHDHDPDETTRTSRGLGALYGDAARTPKPTPVKEPGPVDQAAMEAVAEEYELVHTEEGEHYLTPRDGGSDQPTNDDYPDHPLG